MPVYRHPQRRYNPAFITEISLSSKHTLVTSDHCPRSYKDILSVGLGIPIIYLDTFYHINNTKCTGEDTIFVIENTGPLKDDYKLTNFLANYNGHLTIIDCRDV